jgi:hypothetical protein
MDIEEQKSDHYNYLLLFMNHASYLFLIPSLGVFYF